MAAAATSGAVLNGTLGSSFLSGSKKTQSLFAAASRIDNSTAAAGGRKLVIVSAAKKSWIPAVKGGGNLVDPEWLDGSAAGRLRVRPAGAGEGPGFPEVVQRGGADPRAVGDGGGGGDLRGAGVERDPVVRGRRGARRGGAVLVRDAAGDPIAADGVGGEQAVGGFLQPGFAGGGVGDAVVEDGGELRQRHRGTGLPGRQVLRPVGLRGDAQRRCLRGGRGEAGETEGGGD
ncbi:unnamed protein product [Linum tenue]|uniref:Chlorophyll a-b binding protein, chloroplastic n=1 Tax=Linum tenue TaxID=586396 RepID=A0AAV0MQN2_9ROSI|nr:unnamed protein product [Linum tenue]